MGLLGDIPIKYPHEKSRSQQDDGVHSNGKSSLFFPWNPSNSLDPSASPRPRDPSARRTWPAGRDCAPGAGAVKAYHHGCGWCIYHEIIYIYIYNVYHICIYNYIYMYHQNHVFWISHFRLVSFSSHHLSLKNLLMASKRWWSSSPWLIMFSSQMMTEILFWGHYIININ